MSWDKYVTRKQVIEDFHFMCKLLGKRKSVSYNDIGAWNYEWHTEKSMIRVVEYTNESGGMRYPMGDLHRTYREFHECVYFLGKALEGMLLIPDANSDAEQC